ncbi:comF family protein [Streptococcus urinalis FB127-CNA-2]|uniref:Phosphoribosyl transferase domain protein n=1 Tax=Streptococcus urinalis 2285-97 TaxID=764291 RepID=G5KCS2_9STRE|nr:ComF family protein [Streptococcus urinalis]EHJ57623.1 phosphoribosyl transferase domain protein [Streptococcus urinalis 2285-97]EKS19821.1 comF family protein [Streptococcus urinalis FB127-CNA-2]VEF31397.1 ComF operon protein 3 [Streptococcus urinalis]
MKCILCQEYCIQPLNIMDYLLIRKEQAICCQKCKNNFERVNPNFSCVRCQKKGKEKICSDCKKWEEKGFIINHKALYYYNESMKDYFKKYKFNGDYLLKTVFVNDLKKAIKPFSNYQIITVPISQLTFEKRQFNQMQVILEECNIPFLIPFIKVEGNVQSKKTKIERLNNKNSYRLQNEMKNKITKNILIIDDIYTTGATIVALIKI